MRRYLTLSVLLIPVMAVSAFMVIGRTEAQSANNRVQNVLISGETIIGEVSSIEPAPEFLIAANPGEILSIDIVGIQPDMEPMFRIMDGSDEIIIEEWLTEGSESLHADLFVLRSDRFAVQVQSANGNTGRFSLSVARNEEAFAETFDLALGSTVSGVVNSETPMKFYTLDYSSEEPLMLIVSSPTYMPPVMIENSETRQLVGQIMPPMPAAMMCLAPGMNSHRVDVMYSGDVPEQAYEMTLMPVSGDFARYCTAQLAATNGSAPVILSAFSPLTDVLTPVIPTGGDTAGLDDGGADDIGVADDGGADDIGTDNGGDDGDCAGSGNIQLCLEMTGGGTGGTLCVGELCQDVLDGAEGCEGDVSLCGDGTLTQEGAGIISGGNVGETGINLNGDGLSGQGVTINGDSNAGDQDPGVNVNVGGGEAPSVDANAGDQSVSSDGAVQDVVDGVGGLLGGSE